MLLATTAEREGSVGGAESGSKWRQTAKDDGELRRTSGELASGNAHVGHAAERRCIPRLRIQPVLSARPRLCTGGPAQTDAHRPSSQPGSHLFSQRHGVWLPTQCGVTLHMPQQPRPCGAKVWTLQCGDMVLTAVMGRSFASSVGVPPSDQDGWHCGRDALEVGGGSRPVDAGNGGSANSLTGSRTAIRMADSYKRASWEKKRWPMHRGLLHICRPLLRCWGTRRASTVGCFRTGRQAAVAMEHGWNNGAERRANGGQAEC